MSFASCLCLYQIEVAVADAEPTSSTRSELRVPVYQVVAALVHLEHRFIQRHRFPFFLCVLHMINQPVRFRLTGSGLTFFTAFAAGFGGAAGASSPALGAAARTLDVPPLGARS